MQWCQPPARAPRPPRGAGHGPPAHQGSQQEGLGGLQAREQLSLPEWMQGIYQCRGLGACATTLSVLVLQKSLSSPELGAGMGRGLCLAGQWVLIPHPSTSLREVPHFLTRLSVPSSRPALGGPGQTPGLATGAHRREGPGGNLWAAASLAGPANPSCLGASIRQEGGKEMEEIPKLLSRGKVTTEGKKMLQRSDCPLANSRLGRRHRATLWGGAGQAGCGRASRGEL